RREIDGSFEITADDLSLPMRLFQARRAYEGDDEANAQLDRAFSAIIAGDLATARAILDVYPI
ncbi:MAG: hypothetical protein H7Y09_10160, partial [Chitinophagaceae bacterium]|nr:hypothetical protein [Anaerolineae bacterium]